MEPGEWAAKVLRRPGPGRARKWVEPRTEARDRRSLRWVEPKVGGARSLRVVKVKAAGSRPPGGGGACAPFPSAHCAAGSHARFLSQPLHASGSWRVTFSLPRRRS